MMKKVLMCSLLLGSVVLAGAQNVSFGPVAGINHSWLSDAGGNQSFNPGLNLGATLTYSFSPNWGVGGDLLYSMQGSRSRITSSAATTTQDVALNYVKLQPKLYHFFGKLGDDFRPKLFAGLSVGLLAGGSNKTTISTSNEAADITTKRPSKDLYNSFDGGVLVGTGVNWKLGRAMWFTTDLVYNHGLVDLSKSGSTWQASRSLSLNFGLTFPIGTVDPK